MKVSRKIVFVAPGFSLGGTGPETYARYLWEAFSEDEEIEFHLVAPEFPDSHPRWHASGLGRGSLDLYRRNAETALRVARELGAPQQSVLLHVNNSHLHPMLLNYAGPLWGQVNDYENTDLWRRAGETIRRAGWRRLAVLWHRRRLERRFVARQDLSLCNSEFTRQKILSEYKPPHPERIITLLKAVDLTYFQRPAILPEDPFARPAVARRFIYVGSDIQRKGLDTLLQAVAKFPVGFDWHLSVVGATREQVERTFPGLVSRSLAERIFFAGKVPRTALRQALWHSDVFVLPSRAEALGVALLEALAAGLPVVATNVGGIPEIVRHPSAGRMVLPEKADELAQALQQMPIWPSGVVPPEVQDILASFSTQTMIARLRGLYLHST